MIKQGIRFILGLLGLAVLGSCACDFDLLPSDQLLPGGARASGAVATNASMVRTVVIEGSENPERHSHQMLVINEEIYSIGGFGDSGVYKTVNGQNWVNVTASVPWGTDTLMDFQTVLFDGWIYLLGALDDGTGTRLGDVWLSQDGAVWITTTPPWSPLTNASAAVFQEAIYVMGGANNSNTLSTVWRTNSGVNWTQIESNAPWGRRRETRAAVLNEELYLVAGRWGSTFFNDVWKTADGSTWVQATADIGWGSSRIGFALVVFKDALYILGGITDPAGLQQHHREVYRSSDGQTWEALGDAPWMERLYLGAVVLGNTLYMVGGASGGELKDVWKTHDGENWVELKSISNIQGIASIEDTVYTVAHNNQELQVFRVDEEGHFLEEVNLAVTGVLKGSQVFQKDGKLYVAGGKLDNIPSDVIYEFDPLTSQLGELSTEALPEAMFSHSTALLADYLYVLGGENGGGNSVSYRTQDLQNWESLSAVDALGLVDLGVVAHADHLLLLGGRNDSSGQAVGTVYKLLTDNTIEMVQVSKGFPARYATAGFSYDGRSFIVSGTNGQTVFDTTYQSVDDGVTWELVPEVDISSYGHHTIRVEKMFYTVGGASVVGQNSDDTVYYEVVLS